MVIFFLVIIVAAAALAVFALMPSKESASNEKKQQSESLNSHFVRSELTLKLEEQINSLNVELERFNTEHQQVKAELLLANDLVSNLKEELVRIRKSDKTVEYGELEKLRNENIHLRDEVHRKGLEESGKEAVHRQEYNQISNKCVQLSAELEAFKIEKSDLENKIKMLESQINEYSKEIGKQNEIISQFQNQEKQIDEAFKKEYDDLKNRLEVSESQMKELAKLTKENIDLLGQVKSLEKQIENHSKESKKDGSGGWVSKEKYEELKKKLEKAEEVLRMVHGAGA